MKQFVFLIGFLFSTIFFLADRENIGEDMTMYLHEEQTVLERDGINDIESCLAVLSEDLKNSNLLAPRRVIQTVTYNFNLRSQNQIVKIKQLLRLKEYNSITRLLEEISISHHINLSALLSLNGYHIYALRKLLI